MSSQQRSGRSGRLVQMTRELVERPGELVPLGYFAERFRAAKSTVSEDLALVREVLEADRSGVLRTHAGATGGVQYWPLPSDREQAGTLAELSRLLGSADRIIAGGFVYMADLLSHPVWAGRLGGIFAARFFPREPTMVLTVETKGIPLALMTARVLGIPMVIARRDPRVTEGASVSINYVSGSTRRIQTMTVSLRAIRRDSRVLIIDDFMKAGGTARGMVDLVTELGASVAGIGVLVATAEPVQKRVDDYISLLTIEAVDEGKRQILIRPALAGPTPGE
jgi:purine operon repressor